MTAQDLWEPQRQHLSRIPALGLTLDVSRMRFDAEFLRRVAPSDQRTDRRWVTTGGIFLLLEHLAANRRARAARADDPGQRTFVKT